MPTVFGYRNWAVLKTSKSTCVQETTPPLWYDGSIVFHFISTSLQSCKAILQRTLLCISIIPDAVVNGLKGYRGLSCLYCEGCSWAVCWCVTTLSGMFRGKFGALKSSRTRCKCMANPSTQQVPTLAIQSRCVCHDIHAADAGRTWLLCLEYRALHNKCDLSAG